MSSGKTVASRAGSVVRWGGVALLVMTLAAAATYRLWLPELGRSLVCAGGLVPSDAVLVENFDPDYRLFERAAALQHAGVSPRVFVPTPTAAVDSDEANPVDRGIVELMGRFARVRDLQIIPIHQIEPYSLHAAYQIRDFFTRARVRSVLVLSPAFRSRRSLLVYRSVLTPAGIDVSCLAIYGDHTPDNWMRTWHGIQTVTQQFIKLGYYRFYVVGGLT